MYLFLENIETLFCRVDRSTRDGSFEDFILLLSLCIVEDLCYPVVSIFM